MRRILTILLLSVVSTAVSYAQFDEFGGYDSPMPQAERESDPSKDSQGEKEIPVGLKVWTVDERFGDRSAAEADTVHHMFMNTIFTTGLRGEFNTTGNLGAPRTNRIFINQPTAGQFIFTQPYDFFIVEPRDFHFTNTLSPVTNLTFNTCGDRTNGEDHLTAKFAVNAGKKIGVGFNFDYIYGRGYYASQSTSHFNYTMYGSYLGDRYQAHLLLSTNHQKVTENGGIFNDEYINHPESFSDSYATSEIPTVFDESKNWNRNDNQHVFFSHRYSVGFNRKIPMTAEEIEAKKFAIASKKEEQAREEREKREREARNEGREYDEKESEAPVFAGRPDNAAVVGMEPEVVGDSTTVEDRIAVTGKAMADSLMAAEAKAAEDTSWLKDEYVPVTSFIHTLKLDNYRRIFQSYQTPADYYSASYYDNWRFAGDSIYDETKHYQLRNTFAISMLEGFNKWAKAGVKVFASSDLRHFSLPDSIHGMNSYNEHSLSVGGQISKTEGNTVHYHATAESWLVGEDAGQLKIDAAADLNFRFLGDTLTLAAKGFVYRLNPTFYYRHFHSKHFWWDNEDLDKIFHTRIEGMLRYQKTRTQLRVAVDEIKNHTYFGHSYSMDYVSSGSSIKGYMRTGNAIQVRQCGDVVNLLTVSLAQDFQFGPLCWESAVTYQKSNKTEVLPVPDWNIYSNLYLHFKIAQVLTCDLGADVRYFSSYYAPDYSPTIGQFTVQESEDRAKVGNYPLVNVYANFHLKHTRFFVMMSHVNEGLFGNSNYFLVPHYPLNGRILRFGISWNFFN